jgi:acyl carrier protein
VDEDYFSEDTLIREELGIDSLMAMETLAAIETIYDIEIDENKAFEIVSVGDMMCLIEEYLERKKT